MTTETTDQRIKYVAERFQVLDQLKDLLQAMYVSEWIDSGQTLMIQTPSRLVSFPMDSFPFEVFKKQSIHTLEKQITDEEENIKGIKESIFQAAPVSLEKALQVLAEEANNSSVLKDKLRYIVFSSTDDLVSEISDKQLAEKFYLLAAKLSKKYIDVILGNFLHPDTPAPDIINAIEKDHNSCRDEMIALIEKDCYDNQTAQQIVKSWVDRFNCPHLHDLSANQLWIVSNVLKTPYRVYNETINESSDQLIDHITNFEVDVKYGRDVVKEYLKKFGTVVPVSHRDTEELRALVMYIKMLPTFKLK